MIIFGQGPFGQGFYGGGGFGEPSSSGVGFTADTSSGFYATLGFDPATNDLALPVRILRGDEAIAQNLKSRLQFFLGEWFLDTRLGIPYVQKVFVKNPDMPGLASLFRPVILGTPGMKTLESFSIVLDAPSRTATMNFLGTIDDGRSILAKDEALIV